MRTKMIYSNIEEHNYGAGSGDIEHYEYECPCGKGKIIEDHENIPGFRNHDVYIRCDECTKKYKLDTINGTSGWELIEK